MTLEEFNSYILNHSKFVELKNEAAVPIMNIEWEEDISNIEAYYERIICKQNLGVILEDNIASSLNRTFLKRIDTIEIPGSFTPQLFIESDIERMTTLIRFSSSGNKVAPPLCHCRYKMKDGAIEQLPLEIGDGIHRVRLAKHLNLSEIFIFVVERPYELTFSHSLWSLGSDGKEISIKERDGVKEFRLPLEAYEGKLISSGDYCFLPREF